MRDKSIGRRLQSVAYSKENSGYHWASTTVLNLSHKEHSLSSCFSEHDSLLTALDYLLNR